MAESARNGSSTMDARLPVDIQDVCGNQHGGNTTVCVGRCAQHVCPDTAVFSRPPVYTGLQPFQRGFCWNEVKTDCSPVVVNRQLLHHPMASAESNVDHVDVIVITDEDEEPGLPLRETHSDREHTCNCRRPATAPTRPAHREELVRDVGQTTQCNATDNVAADRHHCETRRSSTVSHSQADTQPTSHDSTLIYCYREQEHHDCHTPLRPPQPDVVQDTPRANPTHKDTAEDVVQPDSTDIHLDPAADAAVLHSAAYKTDLRGMTIFSPWNVGRLSRRGSACYTSGN